MDNESRNIAAYLKRNYPDMSSDELCQIFALAYRSLRGVPYKDIKKHLGVSREFQVLNSKSAVVYLSPKVRGGMTQWVARIEYLDIEKVFEENDLKTAKRVSRDFVNENFGVGFAYKQME